MMKKGRTQNLLMVLAVVALVYVLFTLNNKSEYSIKEREFAAVGAGPSAGPSTKQGFRRIDETPVQMARPERVELPTS